MKFLCVRTTPLLVPVVPEEYKMEAASGCATGGEASSGENMYRVELFEVLGV